MEVETEAVANEAYRNGEPPGGSGKVTFDS